MWSLIRHEWRIHRLELLGVLALFTLTVSLGLWGGWREDQHHRQAIREIEQHETERRSQDAAKTRKAEAKPGKRLKTYQNPLRVAQKGTPAPLPPGPLGLVAIGQADLYPLARQVTLGSSDTWVSLTRLDNPRQQQAGHFDFSFFVIYLYPLLILALTFDLLASEQELGTLRLLLSQPLSAQRLIGAKLLARALPLGLSVWGLSTAGLVLSGISLQTPGLLLRWGLVTLLIIVYGGFWFALSWGVNSLGKPATTNAALLALSWFAALVIVPGAINLGARVLYPVPSRVQFVQATAEVTQAARSQSSKLLSKYFEDHPELLRGQINQAEFAQLQLAKEAAIGEALAPVTARYRQQLAQQQRWVNQLQWFSPSLVAQQVLNELAGNSLSRYQRWEYQLSTFHQRWQAWFIPKIRSQQAVRASDYAAMPRFVWVEPAARQIATQTLAPLAFLGAIALLLSVLGYRQFQRFSPL
jgi:ABC-2 type transport system permease protein